MSSGYRGKRTMRASRRGTVLLAAAVILAVLAAAVFYFRARLQQPNRGPQTGRTSHGEVSTSAAGSGVDGSGSSEPLPPAQGSAEVPPEMNLTPEVPPYDFSQPLPEQEAVDNSYFDDAAFVGDSRTDGLMLYSGIGTGKNLTSNGLSIFKLAEKKALTINGEKYTLLEALALEEYGKVYLSLGVNELGAKNDNAFYESYCKAIDEIRRIQPGAVIYIQGLIPLNEKQIEAANGNKYNLTNEHLRVYNELMRQAAEEKQVVFLDLYSEFVDENGALPEDVSRDGVHLYKEGCQRWLAYLKTHTIAFDTLYPDGPPAIGPEQISENGSGQG